jgi:hypothetical protein
MRKRDTIRLSNKERDVTSQDDERAEYFNTLLAHEVSSSVEAIEDALSENLKGEYDVEALRGSIESALYGMFAEVSPPGDISGESLKTVDLGHLCDEKAARMCLMVSDALGLVDSAVIEQVGLLVRREVGRALVNFIESLVSFQRDVLIDMMGRLTPEQQQQLRERLKG